MYTDVGELYFAKDWVKLLIKIMFPNYLSQDSNVFFLFQLVVCFIRSVTNNGFQILYILPKFQSFFLKSVSWACLLYVNINDVSNF